MTLAPVHPVDIRVFFRCLSVQWWGFALKKHVNPDVLGLACSCSLCFGGLVVCFFGLHPCAGP